MWGGGGRGQQEKGFSDHIQKALFIALKMDTGCLKIRG